MFAKHFPCRNFSATFHTRFFSSPASDGQRKYKTGILMLNLGGPSNTSEVHNFLLRLFSDRDIINLPVQSVLSKFIAHRRTPKIIEQYEEIGGGSPILKWSTIQGDKLVKILDTISPESAPHKFYIGFRYAHPLTELSINEMEKDGIERAVAFSQYPQYSCVTSGSSFNCIAKHYNSPATGGLAGIDKIDAPPSKFPGPVWSFLDRWPVHHGLVSATADHILTEMSRFEDQAETKNTVILFSAHSIPMDVVNRGDTYPLEVAATVYAVMEKLQWKWPYRLVWQSKVGPKAWLGQSTNNALKGLGKQGVKQALMVPIAFTSDHVETLYEMDIEYCAQLAAEAGFSSVRRAGAMNDNPTFIQGLADLVHQHLRDGVTSSVQYKQRCLQCSNANCARTRMFVAAEEERLKEWTTKQNLTAK